MHICQLRINKATRNYGQRKRCLSNDYTQVGDRKVKAKLLFEVHIPKIQRQIYKINQGS